MATIIIPQAIRVIIPPLTNELVLLIKDTSLISVLGVTERTAFILNIRKLALGVAKAYVEQTSAVVA